VIGTVDQGYFRGCLPQSLGGGQSSETAAHDHHMWRLMCHGLQSSGVCLCRQYLGLLGAQLDEVDQQLVLFLRELFDRMASSHLRNPFGDRFLEFRRDIGSAERPHQGCQRIRQMVQNTRPPPSSGKKAARTTLTCPSLCCFCRSRRSSTPRFGFLLLDLPRSLLFSVPGYFVNATRLSASHQPIAFRFSLLKRRALSSPFGFEVKNRCQHLHAIAEALTDPEKESPKPQRVWPQLHPQSAQKGPGACRVP